MLLEVAPARENTTEEDGRVRGRNLGIPNSLAGVQVGKMVKEASVSRHLFPEEAQSCQNPIPRLRSRNESTFFSDAKSGQSKPRRCNACDHGCITPQNIASILYQPSLGTRLVPKVLEVSLLQFVKKLVISRRENILGWRRLWTGGIFLSS